MINWMYFPINKRIDKTSEHIISAFRRVEDDVDSKTHKKQVSDTVLEKVRPELERIDFDVEKSKKGRSYRSACFVWCQWKNRKIFWGRCL